LLKPPGPSLLYAYTHIYMKTIHFSHSIESTRFMSIRALWTIAMLLWISVAAYPSFGQSVTEKPHTISYQGTLMKSGTPVTSGAYKITVTLYNDETGTQSVWADEYNTEVKDGLFNILLGSAKSLPTGIDLDQLYLGVKINGTSELRPLTQIASATTSITVADNSITKDKLATDYIAGISINGKKVTGKGSILNIKDGVGMNLQYDEKTNSLLVNSMGELGNTAPQAIPNWTRVGDPYNAAAGDFVGTAGVGSGDLELRAQNVKVVHYSAGGGVPNINGGAPGNAIGGGVTGSTIAGGGGFLANIILSNSGFVGGGVGNKIDLNSDLSTISGGDQNHIWENSDHATIGGGGWMNEIGSAAGSVASMSFIGGGAYNHIYPKFSVIGGGYFNQIIGNGDDGRLATISGGNSNTIMLGLNSAIGGGAGNQEFSGGYSTIAGGNNNQIMNGSLFGTIGGGDVNMIGPQAPHSFIGGGQTNHDLSAYGTIGGGEINAIDPDAEHSFIGGGKGNHIGGSDAFGTIAGGEGNIIFPGTPQSGDPGIHNTISGGGTNTIDQGTFNDGTHWGVHSSTVSGGSSNNVYNNFSTVAGGTNNNVHGGTSAIGGGSFNTINGPTITNLTIPFSDFSNITGGIINTTDGFNNTILGGNNNLTALASQIACGYFNDASHNGNPAFPTTFAEAILAANSPAPPNAMTLNALSDCYNAPLFMVGNGSGTFFNRTAPHNAFEVSYNGHSVVADINGTGQPHDQAINPNTPDGRAAIEGATYDDNIVYAWGSIASDGTVNSDFGLLSSKLFACACIISANKYLIVLNQVLPDNTNTQRVFTDGSVTATLQTMIQDPEQMINSASSTIRDCRTITCSQLFAHVVGGVTHTAFLVFISSPGITDDFPPQEKCGSSGSGFSFKVCGRKHISTGPSDPRPTDPANEPNTTPSACAVQP
jgi:hypothetical protein